MSAAKEREREIAKAKQEARQDGRERIVFKTENNGQIGYLIVLAACLALPQNATAVYVTKERGS